MSRSATRHDEWMMRALKLASRGVGMTRPNPPVGAVIVRRGTVLGEGYHRRAGGPHAEIRALRSCKTSPRNATLYVTLEPCSSHGRTPPCTDALLESGIAEVVVAVRDPDPRHRGRGLRILKKRGVRVREGIGVEAGRALIEPFSQWVRTGRPFVTLKMGMTLDGRIGDAAGRSRWITSAKARGRVTDLRRRVDAIMVGRDTVIKDNPSLLSPGPNRPYRVILDSTGRLPKGLKIFTDADRDLTILAVTERCPDGRCRRLAEQGVQVMKVGSRNGSVSPERLLKRLGALGVRHVLCEGGGELAASLVRVGVADEYLFFVAPLFLGGGSVPVIGGKGWPLRRAPKLRFLGSEHVGNDILIRARPRSAARSRS